jgi:hypothetical protein
MKRLHEAKAEGYARKPAGELQEDISPHSQPLARFRLIHRLYTKCKFPLWSILTCTYGRRQLSLFFFLFFSFFFWWNSIYNFFQPNLILRRPLAGHPHFLIWAPLPKNLIRAPPRVRVRARVTNFFHHPSLRKAPIYYRHDQQDTTPALFPQQRYVVLIRYVFYC